MDFIYVGIGGFFGACLRFCISKFLNMNKHFFVFPFSTLLSNIIAGILIGVIFELSFDARSKIYLFLVIGFIGGLSTFSAFTLESMNFIFEEKIFFAILNVFLNVLLSFAGFLAGMKLVKLFF